MQAIKQVSERLGNTPAICRKSYVHPEILDTNRDGSLAESLIGMVAGQMVSGDDDLQSVEEAVLCVLEKRYEEQVKAAA